MHSSLHLHKGSLDEIYGRTEIHAKKMKEMFIQTYIHLSIHVCAQMY